MTIEENVREYVRIRINTYIESMIPKQKISDKDELRLYDNCKELLSMIDYCFIDIDFTLQMKLITFEKIHKDQINKIVKEKGIKEL